MLTQLEQRVLSGIAEHIEETGSSPTIAEIAQRLNMRSRGTVHRYVQSLIDKQQLVRDGRSWRGLRIVGSLADAEPGTVPQLLSGQAESLNQLQKVPSELPADIDPTSLQVPLLGRVAAGLPIEALPDESQLDLAAFFIGPDRYALRVTGDSMKDAGIMDGDTVILQNKSRARTGDIVVALIDEREATLKRLGEFSSQVVELIPENSEMCAMRYAATRVSIQGVLIGQLRSY